MVADYEGTDFEFDDAQDFNRSAHEFNAEIHKFIGATKTLSRDSSFDISKMSSPGLEVGEVGDC